MNKSTRFGLVLAGVLVAATSQAAIDTTAATTSIGEITAAIGAVFSALVVVVAAAKGYRFVLNFIGTR